MKKNNNEKAKKTDCWLNGEDDETHLGTTHIGGLWNVQTVYEKKQSPKTPERGHRYTKPSVGRVTKLDFLRI